MKSTTQLDIHILLYSFTQTQNQSSRLSAQKKCFERKKKKADFSCLFHLFIISFIFKSFFPFFSM